MPMKSLLKNKKLWMIIFIGLAVRLLLMPITLHPDIWSTSFAQYFFAFKSVPNIYEYLSNLPLNDSLSLNYGRNFWTYPPFAYFSIGIFGLILRPLVNADFIINLAGNLPNIYNDNRLYLHLFLTKLPYLFFDFGILWLLINFFDEEKKKRLAVFFWLFNPLILYTTYMIGQFDIIPVFWTVLALYLSKKKNINWAVFCLGIGGAYKMFPLFFIPFLAISEGGNFKKSIKLLTIGFLPYALSILPFINSVAFRQTVLFSNQSQKMLFMKLSLSGAEYLSVFITGYIFLIVLCTIKKLSLWKWFLMIMLLLFGVTHYHPQWFLWLTPFLIIFMIEKPKYRLLPAVILLTWLIITLLFEPSLSISLFAPLSKNLISVKPLSETINRYYNVFDFRSLVRSVSAGISLGIAVLLFKNEETA